MVKALRADADLNPAVRNLPHPAAHLLDHLRKHGAPMRVHSGAWTREQLDEATHRGSRYSARQNLPFLTTEMMTMIQKGQWMILPYDDVKHIKNLRLSPLGVVPQRDRRPRTIADYTFSGVNADTVPLTAHLEMQFGKALPRILWAIVHSDPRHGPVYLIKIDLADGFYRIYLAPRDIPLLGVAFPTEPGQPFLVAFPLALPMGWTSSPPIFCAATETAADLANAAIREQSHQHPHRLDAVAEPLPHSSLTAGSHRLTDKTRPLAITDVFVDDHIALAQGSLPELRMVRRQLLHAIDSVFRQLGPQDHSTRQDPISLKKLAKGDGQWSTQQVILGWSLDTVAMTITLPPHRAQRLHDLLQSIPTDQKRISTRIWHKTLGELRSMALALPGSRGLFGPLQEVLRHPTTQRRVRLGPAAHDFLQDFRWLAQDLTTRPTRFQELVPQEPRFLGSCDASGAGMGGVWLPANPRHPGLLWRQAFPHHVTAALVSATNRAGAINNSELELVGALAHQDILANQCTIAETSNALFNDNTAAIHWLRRGSTTTTGATAYLLRWQALHQRHHRYLMSYDYVPGPQNQMADDCSRLWHFSDTDLLSHFDSHYPQAGGWKLCHLPSATTSALISALQRRRPAPASYLPGHSPPTDTGAYGRLSALTSTWTPTLPTSTWTPSSSSACSQSDTEPVGWHHMDDRSKLARWKTPCAQWVRRWPFWGPRTLGSIA